MASRLYHSNYLFPDYPNSLSSSPTFHTPPGHVAGSADSDTFPLLIFDHKTPPFDVSPPPVIMPPLVVTNTPFPEWTVPTLPELRRSGTFLSPPPPPAVDMYCECSDDHRDGFYCNRNLLCRIPNIVTPDHYINSLVLEGKVNEDESTLPEMKIGKYSAEERKERILRYLKKRNQRNFTKTIKYECRKTLADKRVRIRGRFAKNNINNEPTSDEEMMMVVVADNKKHYESDFVRMEDNNMMMMKQLQEYGGGDDDIHEFWYQDSLASLIYQQFPH